MDILNGIKNFLTFVDSNWTSIVVIITLIMSIYKKVENYIGKSKEEKIAIAKKQIHEEILKMISDAEMDYEEWNKAGSIKRSQVIGDIYVAYPILSRVVNQEELVKWIDSEIDSALDVLREIIKKNEENE